MKKYALSQKQRPARLSTMLPTVLLTIVMSLPSLAAAANPTTTSPPLTINQLNQIILSIAPTPNCGCAPCIQGAVTGTSYSGTLVSGGGGPYSANFSIQTNGALPAVTDVYNPHATCYILPSCRCGSTGGGGEEK